MPERKVLSQRDQGFSLVELIVAMLVIAIVLMLLIGVQVSAMTSVTEARKLQQATALANEAIEQMRATPWFVLSKGMYSGYLTASGGDDLVEAGYLNVDGRSVRILVAPLENNQDLNDPWRPLFDDKGSHTQTRQDPSLAGVDFTVKAYVTEGIDGDTGTLGIAVVVEWPGSDGQIRRTTVWSTVYQSGCGATDTQPFLAACQDFFQASASSGDISMGLSATTVPAVDDPSTTSVALTTPASGTIFTAGVRTASAAATIRSQQVNLADSYLRFGGNQTDDNNPDTASIVTGYAIHELRATDDLTSTGGWVANPLDISVTQDALHESVTTVPSSSVDFRYRLRSDYGRPGTLKAAMAGSCMDGIPEDQPCAWASLANNANAQEGSGYIVMDHNNDLLMRVSRRMSESGGSVDTAWAARFASRPGDSTTGCTTLTGSGCVAAGAERTMAPLRIGNLAGGDGTWNGGAGSGLVIIEGHASCTGSYYRESVRVERGPGQVNAVPAIYRCGGLRYWTGSGYDIQFVDHNTSAILNVPETTWSNGTYTIRATATVRIEPGYFESLSPAGCTPETCSVTASAGSISVVATYHLSWGSHEHLVISTTDVTSPSATASYKSGADE